jgi:hypothetical protein
MLELSWANATPQAQAATGTVADGLTRVQFAQEAINALTPVLEWKTVAADAVTVADQVYTGAALTPAVAVKHNGSALAAGSDYTVAYSDNTQVGLATVTIKGTGNYIGTKVVTFRINPQATSIKTITSGKKKLTVVWTKVAGTTKYVVQYRLKGASAWKSVSVAGSKGSVVIAKLKKGKKYQLRIQDYKTVAGVPYYSAVSAVRTSKAVK